MRLYYKFYADFIKERNNAMDKKIKDNKYVIMYGEVHKCQITKDSIILHCGESRYDKSKNVHKEIGFIEYIVKYGLNRLINKFGGHIFWWSKYN